MAKSKKSKKTSKKKSKKVVKTARKAPAKKKAASKKAKKPAAKKAAKRSPIKKSAKRVAKKATRKAVKKPARKLIKKKQIVGEGDYAATKAFDKDQAGFVKANKARIPAMAKEAEKALEGPEGDSLRDAEAAAAARSRDNF